MRVIVYTGKAMTQTLSSYLLDRFGHIEGVNKGGDLNVRALAQHLQVHPYTIWRWFKLGLSWKGATILMDNNSSVTREDILPFLRG